MPPFLPNPYPDELYYSILARYHVWSQNISYKDTMWDLYSSRTACAVMDLPNRLLDLYLNLPSGSLLTPDRIIQENTLFPLYRPFLPKKIVMKVFCAMKGKKRGGSIHMMAGVMASGITSPRFLRFCPECLEDDEEHFGEAYWHRTHQVSGVKVCPLHGSILVESNVAVSSPQNKHAYIALSKNMTGRQIPISKTIDRDVYYSDISKAVYWLLTNEVSTQDLKELQRRYSYYLYKMDLATYSGRVKQKDLINTFNNFYGQDFLSQFESNIDINQSDNWLSKLVRNPRSSTHPIRHILLMIFLGTTPEEFFKRKTTKILPFGKGPWPCLNKTVSHYRKRIITDCKISRDTKNGLPVGTFSCSCGFTYSRRGPDQKDTDCYRIGRFKSFGPTWENRLLQLVSEGEKGLRETAKFLNVDPKTVKFQLDRLQKKQDIVPTKNNPLQDGYKRNNYRTRWLEVVHNNPGRNRKELRHISQAEFTWLYRHDRKWLVKNSPAPQPRKKYIDRRVDWDKRDEELVKLVVSASEEILKHTKPVRLTVSSIGKHIGKLPLIQKHLNKLPKTKEKIESLLETDEDFMIRRVKNAVTKLNEKGEPIRVWKVLREAGLKPYCAERVDMEIKKEFSNELTY